MFQKSCLLKCISTATNEHSIFEKNYGLYTVKRVNDSHVLDADKAKLTKRSTKEWRDSFKKSFNSTIKKSVRRIKKANVTAKGKKDLVSQSINGMPSIDMFKKPNVFSSTLVNNVSKYQNFEAERSQDLFRHEYSDSSDDDESDLDISMDQNDYDLNSSLSSVSSLEFEPFESSSSQTCTTNSRRVSINRQTNVKKSIVKPPLISSSRSNITASTFVSSSSANDTENSRLINFESCTTSSRLSLLSSQSQRANVTSSFVSYANPVRKQENDCSMCNNHQINQICSSTMINNTMNCNNSNIDFILSTSRVSVVESISNNSSRNSSSLSAYSSCSSLNDSLNNQTVFRKFD
jgi:hypothetical protein